MCSNCRSPWQEGPKFGSFDYVSNTNGSLYEQSRPNYSGSSSGYL